MHVGCEREKVYLVHARHSAVQQQNDFTMRGVKNDTLLKLHAAQMEGVQNLSLVSVLQSDAKIIRKIKPSPFKLYSIHRQNRILIVFLKT